MGKYDRLLPSRGFSGPGEGENPNTAPPPPKILEGFGQSVSEGERPGSTRPTTQYDAHGPGIGDPF